MEKNHPKVNFGKTGILIINLGTPDSTSWLDIRKYLREFLSDRRVIEVNPIIWKVITLPAELKTSTSPKPIVVIVMSTIHKQSPQSQPSVMR